MINRKAKYNYHILEEYQAGIVLVGSEVKSIRENDVSIDEAYCLFIGNELFIRNMYIKPYEKSTDNQNPIRDRKLLLTKKELKSIKNEMVNNGLTIVPLVLTMDGLVKIKIGIGRGKKSWDKRQTIKERDIQRELDRNGR